MQRPQYDEPKTKGRRDQMEAKAAPEQPQRTHAWSAHSALQMIPNGRAWPPGHIALATYRKDPGALVTICYSDPQDMTNEEMITTVVPTVVTTAVPKRQIPGDHER